MMATVARVDAILNLSSFFGRNTSLEHSRCTVVVELVVDDGVPLGSAHDLLCCNFVGE
jgi:hypothetical protein